MFRKNWRPVLAILFAFQPIFSQYLTPESTLREVPPKAPEPIPEEKPKNPTPPPTVIPRVEPIVQVPYEGQFIDFAAYAREKNIILTWHFLTGRTKDFRVQVYRFTQEPRVIHDISQGVLIAKLTGDINIYEDVPAQKGAYYYAIFVETPRGLEPGSFTPARNLVGPIYFRANEVENPLSQNIPKPPPNVTDDSLVGTQNDYDSESVEDYDAQSINLVLRKTYLRGKHKATLRALRPYLHSQNQRVKAKAIFYTGLAYYRLGQSERAIKYFEHPLTQKYYRRNAEFWLNQVMENTR
ncbi:MAG: hypothetical protein LDLANPLL_01269 [Turneriella sp.]|nr:hypothetical protein [Turneriella sp.]